ncbi:MAG: PAS domain S-box protein, partial [Planctomycetota bacterium]|nr:PAS domain S-box protein [Planctomycetota bacterium]
EALQAFMDIDVEPGSNEFFQFAGTLLKNNRSIQGLAWAPQVKSEDLADFLTKRRLKRPKYALKKATDKGFRPAELNAELYFPIRFVTTLRRKNRAEGLDLGSNSQLRKSLLESRDTGKIRFESPSGLLPQNKNRGGILLVVLPVYHGKAIPKTQVERRGKFRGFVLGLFRMNRVLVEVISREERKQFEITIMGQGGGFVETVVFKNIIKDVHDLRWESSLTAGSRAWLTRIRPSDAYWQRNSAYVSRFVLLGALMSGFFLNAFLLIFAGRNSRVERLVQERTVELSQSNLFLDSLVDTIPDAIIARDASNGQFALLNKAGEDRLGQSQFRLNGKTMNDVLPTDEASRSREQDRLVLSEQKLLDIAEEPYQSAEGKRFARTRKAPIFGPDGQVRYLLSISTDITKEREIRAALEESKDRYAALVELAPDAFVIVNLAGIVLIVNSKSEELFGYKRAEILGQDVSSLFPREEVKKSKWLLHEGSDLAPQEVVGRHKDGSLLPLELTLGSIENIDERLLVGAFRDTRMRRKAEIAVAQLQEIHHRVKNNLQIVLSLLRLQARQVKDPRLESLLSESGSRIQAMALIHEQLYQSETVDRIQFAEFLRSLKEKLVLAYARQAKNLKVVLDEGIEPWLPIDRCVPAGLIVHELVLNSFLHAFPDDRPGEILIKLKIIDQAVIEIEVADDGIGFPADKDFRTSDSLGLQLVNDLIEQLKGEIHLEVDGGSRFIARFPMNPNGQKS